MDAFDQSALLSPIRIHNGLDRGIYLDGAGTRGHLKGCDIAGNARAGVFMQWGASPLLTDCK